MKTGVLPRDRLGERYVEIYYNAKSPLGPGFSSGSIRQFESDILQWLTERTKEGPILITHVEEL